jgi:hypothetical protein
MSQLSSNQKSLNQFRIGISNIEYQILIGKDGDVWCALLGTDIQEGYSGFGHTVKDALFDLANKL